MNVRPSESAIGDTTHEAAVYKEIIVRRDNQFDYITLECKICIIVP